MNPELKELIALLQYRNSVGESLQNIVMTRSLFMCMCAGLMSFVGLIDDESVDILRNEDGPGQCSCIIARAKLQSMMNAPGTVAASAECGICGRIHKANNI